MDRSKGVVPFGKWKPDDIYVFPVCDLLLVVLYLVDAETFPQIMVIYYPTSICRTYIVSGNIDINGVPGNKSTIGSRHDSAKLAGVSFFSEVIRKCDGKETQLTYFFNQPKSDFCKSHKFEIIVSKSDDESTLRLDVICDGIIYNDRFQAKKCDCAFIVWLISTVPQYKPYVESSPSSLHEDEDEDEVEDEDEDEDPCRFD